MERNVRVSSGGIVIGPTHSGGVDVVAAAGRSAE